MIDLHCHILPGLDDGASDIEVSLAMARIAVGQGIETTACTPHILPGVYHNSGSSIRPAVAALQERLAAEAIPLQLVVGADVHMCPDFVSGLRSGRLISLADSRYVLVEPPHHTAPPHFESFFFNLVAGTGLHVGRGAAVALAEPFPGALAQEGVHGLVRKTYLSKLVI